MTNFGGHQNIQARLHNLIALFSGEALMVHFSYFTTVKQILEFGFLKEYENIVLMELSEAFPRELWNATDFF